MADFRTRLQLDGSDFNSTLNDAGKSVNDFQKKTQDASKQVDDLGKSTKKTASELLNEMRSMEGLGRSTSNYRSQLAQMTRQIQDLTINYNQMSNEMKNSDFGREVASQIQELTKRASEMKDQVQDAANSVKLLSSDTANLDAAKSAIEGLSAGFQLVASAGILGEESTEKVIKALARLKAIESATNAVIKISNILNKDSILMLKIKDLQTKAATKSTLAHAAATGKATVAQRLFNTVAKANPYVLLASAILAVVGALTAFDRYCGQAEDAQDDLNKELKEGIDLNKTYKDSFNNAFVPLLTTFKKLQTGWKDLKTDLEKTEFIKKNADEFKKLGVEVTNVKQAEDILVNNSQLFLKTLELRAKAAAAASVAMEAYKEAMNIDMKGFDKLPKAGDLVPSNVQNPRRYGLAWDHMEADGMHHDYKFTEQGAEQYIIENQLATAYINKTKAINKANQALQQEVDIERELQSIMSQFGSTTTTTNGGSGNEGDPFEVGSATYYSKLIDEINKKLQNQVNTKEQILEYEKQIQMLEGLRDRALGKESSNLIPQLPMRTGLENVGEIKVPATLSVQEVEFEDITFADLNAEISDAISGFQSMNSAVANVGKSIEDLGSGWDESKSALENITTKVSDVFSIMQSVCTVIDTMNKLAVIFESIENVSWMLQKKKNSEETKGLVIKAAGVALSEQEATANAVGAAGSVAESAGKIPYVGWILAIAAVAGIIAAIASAKSSIGFAKGGIVPGNSFSGDNIAANLNSGEMVLNTNQQARLFDLLNGSGSINGGSNKVEFVIKGQELKGVLSNYDKKMSRI